MLTRNQDIRLFQVGTHPVVGSNRFAFFDGGRVLVLSGSIVEVANTDGADEWSERRRWCWRREGSPFAFVVILPFATRKSVRLGLPSPIGRHGRLGFGWYWVRQRRKEWWMNAEMTEFGFHLLRRRGKNEEKNSARCLGYVLPFHLISWILPSSLLLTTPISLSTDILSAHHDIIFRSASRPVCLRLSLDVHMHVPSATNRFQNKSKNASQR